MNAAVAYVAENLTPELRVFNLTVSEFKALKKAITVLVRAGISYDIAVATLLESRRYSRR